MISKKYGAEYKRQKVEEYLEEIKIKKISKAEFAAKNNISDSTFNDWVLKYQRDKQGFCNITCEIAKLNEIETIDTTDYIVRNVVVDEENGTYIKDKDYIRLHYNGAVLEFNEIILERVMKIVKEW